MDTFKELPRDIQDEAFKYSHNPQNKNLLDDINDFYDSYVCVKKLYQDYINHLNYDENIKEMEMYGWLANNICLMIQDKTGVNGFASGLNQDFIELMKNRSMMFQLNEKKIVEFFLTKNEQKNTIEYIRKECKYLWSMLTVEERIDMIRYIQNRLDQFE